MDNKNKLLLTEAYIASFNANDSGVKLLTDLPSGRALAKDALEALRNDLLGRTDPIEDVVDERRRQRTMYDNEQDDENSRMDWRNYRTRYEDLADRATDRLTLRRNLVKIAALAVAQIEAIDREIARENRNKEAKLAKVERNLDMVTAIIEGGTTAEGMRVTLDVSLVKEALEGLRDSLKEELA